MDSNKTVLNSQEHGKISIRIKELRQNAGLTQEQLAIKSSVPYTTLTKIESGVIKNPSISAISKIAQALGTSLDDFSLVQTYFGKNALTKLFDDILNTLPFGEEMYISGIQEQLFIDSNKESLNKYINKLAERKNTQKLISCEGDKKKLKGKHLAYRWIPKEYFNPTPIYTYGNKIATVIWGPPEKVIILNNNELADAFKKQFLFIWKYAKPFK